MRPGLERCVVVVVVAVLGAAGGLLADGFDHLDVRVADCPDLTGPTYGLTCSGLGGEGAVVMDVGGPPYLLPTVRRDKVYELGALLRRARPAGGTLLGAGAGPWPHAGTNCEGVFDLTVLPGEPPRQGSGIVLVRGDGYEARPLPPDETRAALLGNFLVCGGEAGPVVRVEARGRRGTRDFVTAVRDTLAAHYGQRDVALGGVVVLRAGTARYHVMPDFSKRAINTDKDLQAWLRFFELRAPLVNVGTLVTGAVVQELDLRPQHFHGRGARGDGGHHHVDTSPDVAHYEALLVPAVELVRVDAPPVTHEFGRD